MTTLEQSIARLRTEGFVIDAKTEPAQRAQCVIALLELQTEKAQESANFPEPNGETHVSNKCTTNERQPAKRLAHPA